MRYLFMTIYSRYIIVVQGNHAVVLGSVSQWGKGAICGRVLLNYYKKATLILEMSFGPTLTLRILAEPGQVKSVCQVMDHVAQNVASTVLS